ncbi:hypothetical protein pb186bvf_007836 [Paramecium bursaria]
MFPQQYTPHMQLINAPLTQRVFQQYPTYSKENITQFNNTIKKKPQIFADPRNVSPIRLQFKVSQQQVSPHRMFTPPPNQKMPLKTYTPQKMQITPKQQSPVKIQNQQQSSAIQTPLAQTQRLNQDFDTNRLATTNGSIYIGLQEELLKSELKLQQLYEKSKQLQEQRKKLHDQYKNKTYKSPNKY